MNILVVNDDGIDSYGIKLLAKKLMKYGNIFVVAPHREQSAIGHGITIHDSMRLRIIEDFHEGIQAWSLDGKPADCVKFAIHGLKLDIDLVVSGINNGPNMGTDIIYSGTIAGASEGVICNLPAIAVSTDFNYYTLVENELEWLFDRIIQDNILDPKVVINVNFPSKDYEKSKGIKITKQGYRPYAHEYTVDGDSYWAKGTWAAYESKKETDVHACENGYISITPLKIDRTDYEYIDRLKKQLL